MTRARSLLVFAAFLLPLHGVLAAEAAYPVRPIRLIVPFVAGGGTDLLARLISPRLGEVLGQQIVIDNRGGGASILGTQLLAKAPPDGYTIAMMDTAFAINPGFAESLPYNVERDFVYVAIIATNPTVLVARSSLKARTLQDLIAAAKANPGGIKAASAGVGSSSHLSIELLMTAAKVRFLHVPYKGAGAAIQDMLGGHADFTFAVPGSVTGQVQSGAFVALAVNKPTNVLPNTPTFAAAGIPMVNPEAFRFIITPAGTAPAVNQKLANALSTIMAEPELKKRLVDNGYDPDFHTGKEAREFVMREIGKWRQAVKAAGAKPN